MISYHINPEAEAKHSLAVNSGLVINNIIQYDIHRFYKDRPTIKDVDIENYQKRGYSYRLGLSVLYQIKGNVHLKTNLFSDYQFILDHYESKPDYKNLLDDRHSIGFSIGVVYKLMNTKRI